MTKKLLCFPLMPELSGGSEPPVADGMNVLQREQKCVTERIFSGHNEGANLTITAVPVFPHIPISGC